MPLIGACLTPGERAPRWSKAPTIQDPEVEQKHQELDQMIEAICNHSSPYDGFINDPSSDTKTIQVPLPRYFKALQLENYNGTIDSIDHLKSFEAMMLLYGTRNTYIYTYIHTCKDIYMYVCMHAWMDICLHAYVCIYMYGVTYWAILCKSLQYQLKKCEGKKNGYFMA